MTDEPQNLVDRLAASLPRTEADLAALVGAGQVARRRRRRATTAGTLTLVVLMVLGGLFVPRVLGHRPTPSDASTRLVGYHGLTIQVPRSWPTVAYRCPTELTAFVLLNDPPIPPSLCPMVGNANVVDTVRFGSLPGNEDSREVMKGAIGGLEVRRSGVRCQAKYDSCAEQIIVAAADASIRINIHGRNARARLEHIRDSLRAVPAGQTAVPLAEDAAFDKQTAADEDAGLQTTVALKHDAGALPGTVLGSSPVPGTVLPKGSTVTYTIADVAPPATHVGLTDEQFGTALAVAREYVQGNPLPAYIRATVSLTGSPLASTGRACTHGPPLHVTIFGVHTGLADLMAPPTAPCWWRTPGRDWCARWATGLLSWGPSPTTFRSSPTRTHRRRPAASWWGSTGRPWRCRTH